MEEADGLKKDIKEEIAGDKRKLRVRPPHQLAGAIFACASLYPVCSQHHDCLVLLFTGISGYSDKLNSPLRSFQAVLFFCPV